MNALLDIARGEIGVSERSNPERVGEYLRTVGLRPDPSIPWCSAFVCWCLDEIGYAHPAAPNARAFENYGVAAKREPGTIVVLRRGTRPQDAWKGHVGIVSDRDDPTDDHHIRIVSGNSSDAVRDTFYPVADVLCYRAPKHVKDSKVVKAAVAGGAAEISSQVLAEPSVADAVQQTVTELTPAVAGLTVPHIRAVLSIVTVCCLLYALYDRVMKIREARK